MTSALETMPPVPPPAAVAAAPLAATAPEPRAPSPFLPPREYDDWSDEEKREDRLRAEAERYAILNTKRVQLIRKLGRLPDNYDFETPRPELLHQIIHGNCSNLRWADAYEPYQDAAG
jgi:hypothetical protein